MAGRALNYANSLIVIRVIYRLVYYVISYSGEDVEGMNQVCVRIALDALQTR